MMGNTAGQRSVWAIDFARSYALDIDGGSDEDQPYTL
jgi:hypothetical protein